MLLRRLLSCRPLRLRLRLETLASNTTTTTSSSLTLTPLSGRSRHNPLPFGLPFARCLSASGPGGRGDGDQPWTITPDSVDPDPFGDEAAAASSEAPLAPDAAGDTLDEAPLVPDPAGESSWAEGFGGKGENGDLFDDIYKEAAGSVVGAAAQGSGFVGTGVDEPWTLGGEEEEDDFAGAVSGEEGIGGGDGLEGLGAAADEDEERQRQENRVREQELMEVLKGPNRAFGDVVAASGITEDMIDSLILLRDVRNIKGLPPLTEIQDKAIEKLNEKTSRAEIERKKQEEIAMARVRKVDEKGRSYGTGRRKCSVARVWIQPGDGSFVINDKQFDAYFPILDHRAELLRPFTVTKTLGLWDVNCTVKGGGVSGQVGAIRLGISRALQNWEPGFRPYLKSEGYLTRDPRVVERKKPGKAKARKSFQWVKR